MEIIGLTFFILGLLGYLISEDFIGHLWGTNFINTSFLFFLISLEKNKSFKIDTEEIFFIYVSITLLLISSLFVIRHKAKQEKIEEMQ